jgi:hypothetical protein
MVFRKIVVDQIGAKLFKLEEKELSVRITLIFKPN